MGYQMDKEHSLFLMDGSMKVDGCLVNIMVKEHGLPLVDTSM